jgi:hypothetical protein
MPSNGGGYTVEVLGAVKRLWDVSQQHLNCAEKVFIGKVAEVYTNP